MVKLTENRLEVYFKTAFINEHYSQVTLTILDINRERLLKCTEDGEAMQVLNEYFEGVYNDEAMALSTEPRSPEKVIQKLKDFQKKDTCFYT